MKITRESLKREEELKTLLEAFDSLDQQMLSKRFILVHRFNFTPEMITESERMLAEEKSVALLSTS